MGLCQTHRKESDLSLLCIRQQHQQASTKQYYNGTSASYNWYKEDNLNHTTTLSILFSFNHCIREQKTRFPKDLQTSFHEKLNRSIKSLYG